MGPAQFRVFDANGLSPLENRRDTWSNDLNYLIGAPEVASFSVTANLSDGVQPVALSAEFTFDGEILVLVNRAERGVDLCIWRIDSERQQITVLSQRWWSESDADFGYQWITRVAVEASSV